MDWARIKEAAAVAGTTRTRLVTEARQLDEAADALMADAFGLTDAMKTYLRRRVDSVALRRGRLWNR